MPVKSIDAATAKRWLENGEAVMVDVREPAEHRAENIAGAHLLPLAKIRKQALPPLGDKKLIIHCLSGRRGASACEKLLAEDPLLDVYNLEGGISAWRQAGNQVNRSGKNFLPLDQQVQLTIGIGVLTGSFLAYLVSPLFLLLTGFFGAGLTFAGLTGFCGLARLMAKMPWNQGAHESPSSGCVA